MNDNMIWIIKNIKDGRVVLKHKEFDRYYVSGPIKITDNIETELYTTRDLEQAYNVLEAIKYLNYRYCAGINANDWRVVEAPG